MREKYLEIRSGTVAYGTNIVLDNVNLRLGQGEFCSLLGPNGSGKTSLIRVLLGLKRLKAGDRFSGFGQIGYVPQARRLDRQFPVTVLRCLETDFVGPAYLWRPGKRRRMYAKIQKAMDVTGIAHRAHQLLRECSGGELQRTLIARALVLEPELLVLDEPTNNLDKQGKIDILALLDELHQERGLTVLMTTHETDPALLDLFSSQIELEGREVRKIQRARKSRKPTGAAKTKPA